MSSLTVENVFNLNKIAPVLSINPTQIYLELVELIRNNNTKVLKRKQRLMIVSKLLGIEYEDIENEANNAEIHISEDYLWKKETCSFITNLTCDKTYLYDLSMKIFFKVRTFLSEDYILSPYIERGDILFILKGGNAQKRSLKKFFVNEADEIDAKFGLDGDNDTCIMINPKLSIEEFNECFISIINLICVLLGNLRESVEIKQITEIIESCIGHDTEIRSVKRRNNDITKGTFFGEEKECYITRCDRYDFIPSKKFALIRLLKSYEIIHHSFATRGPKLSKSEILDISILHRDNEVLERDFEKFQTLEYAYIIDDDIECLQ